MTAQPDPDRRGENASGTNVLVIPVAQTAIGVVVNPPTGCEIEEITNKQLESVMRGNVKIWNKIQTATGAGCVNAPITRVVRFEGSGTTYQFKNYLQEINPSALACTEGGKTWKQLEEIGTGEKPNTTWPENGVGGCAANAVSPVTTGTGGGAVVKNVTSPKARSATPLCPTSKRTKRTAKTRTATPTGSSSRTTVSPTSSPSLRWSARSKNSATAPSASHTRYVVPVSARVGSANPANSDWSQVFGADTQHLGERLQLGSAYPLCTLTYDVALTNYSKAGFSEAAEITARDYITNYVTAAEGQELLETGGKWYSPLPEGSAAFNVAGAAKLAASKIGF